MTRTYGQVTGVYTMHDRPDLSGFHSQRINPTLEYDAEFTTVELVRGASATHFSKGLRMPSKEVRTCDWTHRVCTWVARCLPCRSLPQLSSPGRRGQRHRPAVLASVSCRTHQNGPPEAWPDRPLRCRGTATGSLEGSKLIWPDGLFPELGVHNALSCVLVCEHEQTGHLHYCPASSQAL